MDGVGIATYSTDRLREGSHVVFAMYEGTLNFSSSISVPIIQKVIPAFTATTTHYNTWQ